MCDVILTLVRSAFGDDYLVQRTETSCRCQDKWGGGVLDFTNMLFVCPFLLPLMFLVTG